MSDPGTVRQSEFAGWVADTVREFRATQAEGIRVASNPTPPHDSDVEALKRQIEAHERRFDKLDGTIETVRVEMRAGFAAVSSALSQLPTKASLWGMIGATFTVGIGVVGIFVAILTYLQDQRIDSRPAAPQAPVNFYIQAPSTAPQPAPTAPQPEAPRQ